MGMRAKGLLKSAIIGLGGGFLIIIVSIGILYILHTRAKDLDSARMRVATEESARFVEDHMPDSARSIPNRLDLLSYSLKQVDPKINGLYCEFGVFEGQTIRHIASQVQHKVHGFDSFEGLPEDWSFMKKGSFKMDKLPEVPANVMLHKGWFNESLPVFKKEYGSKAVSFLHLDADLYSSTKTVFDELGAQIVPGTVIVFDEYFNYPGWKQGEYRAFREFSQQRGVRVEYLGFAVEQVAMKVLALDAPQYATAKP